MTDQGTGKILAQVPQIGLGCMNLSHAYADPPPRADAERLLHHAYEIGVRHFDTAALYGFGRNEELVGAALRAKRDSILLASKCGMTGVNGQRVIDGRPATIMKTCDESLRRLHTDVIDLYYLHRWDKQVPIEDSMGAMQRLVEAGKVRDVGLSEVSASTLRKAHAVHPVSAVQSEYSLWSRNVELSVLETCTALGITFVAFSPLARGFLTDVNLVPAEFAARDIRRGMPRFQEPDFSKNAGLLKDYRELAARSGCSAAQLALAWLLQRYPGLHAVPGTTRVAHLEENFAALEVRLSAAILQRADELINAQTVAGPRYNAATQAEIDTEEFVR
jgi:aryl-alcohol dehydrogenase-like predicted oxidoreductase